MLHLCSVWHFLTAPRLFFLQIQNSVQLYATIFSFVSFNSTIKYKERVMQFIVLHLHILLTISIFVTPTATDSLALVVSWHLNLQLSFQ